jgi:hypothetical protein
MTVDGPRNTGPSTGRILIFSLRNIFDKDLFRCSHYEFEDIISDIDSAVLWAPAADPSTNRFKFATRLAYHAPIMFNPGIDEKLTRVKYEMFFMICAFPQDLILLNSVGKLMDICKTSVCLLDELWAREIVKNRHFLRVLAKFDRVILYYSQTVKPLNEIIGRRCVFLPPSVDAILFCPYPDPPKRVIDIYSIGRRSEITHQHLLMMAREGNIFYVHDTIRGNQAINQKEHRELFANVAKRSRYFIVNPGLIDQPEKRGNQIEIGSRFFEGVASGAIMVGERPTSEHFDTLFDWDDAVISVPYNSRSVDKIIAALDADPERQERIRRTNIIQALTRHDCVYRWEAILKIADLEPMRGALERKTRLKELAEIVSQTEGDSGRQTIKGSVFPVTSPSTRGRFRK